MTNAEWITLLLSRLVRKAASFRDLVVLETNTYLKDKEKNMLEPPYFLETNWEGAVSGSWTELPVDFLTEIEETTGILIHPSGEKTELVKRVHADVQSIAAANGPAAAAYYSLLGTKIYFAPALDQEYQIQLPYGRKSVELVDNDDEAEDWIKEAGNAVCFTIQYLLALNQLQDAEMASRFQAEAGPAWKAFHDYCNKRKFTNVHIAVGEDE